MSKVLVTGGSGFIGVYVMKRLVEKGHHVINYDAISPSGEGLFILDEIKDKIEFQRGGIEDLPTILTTVKEHCIEKIVHIAAVVDPPFLHQNPTVAYRVNLGGTLNVLETARIMHLKRVVYISSIGVFTSKKYEPIDENHPVLQSNEGQGSAAYGAAKIGSEAFCWSYRDAFNLDFIILRPSAVYGFGMKYPIFIKPIIENAVRGEPLEFKHGRDLPRDYTYVKDVAQAVQLSVDVDGSKLKDRVFMIATGHKLITPGDLIEIIKERIPTADVKIGPGLEEYDKREALYRGLVSIERAREQLGYKPEFDIRKGVADYITTYKNYYKRNQVE